MKNYLLLASILILNAFAFSQSATNTYTVANIPVSFGAYSATCNGAATPLTVTIPAGANVTSINVSYAMTAQGGAWLSEQNSRVRCVQTGNLEATFTGVGNVGGVQNYNRVGVNIANGISATGTLTFELQAWRTWGGTACDQAFQFINNNSWTVTVFYTLPTPMTYTSSTTTQASTANIPTCATSAEILGVQVVTNGALTPLSLTQLSLTSTGSTSMASCTGISVYYTGSSTSFATTTLFGTAASGATFTVNGTQTLGSGNNYFWVVYNVTAPPIANTFDGTCTGLVVSGTAYVPTVTSPAGNRVVSACNPTPGGQSTNLQTWFHSNAGTVGSPVTAWNNQGPNAAIPNLTASTGGALISADPRANFNNIVQCLGTYETSFHREVSTRTQVIAGNQVTMYTAYQQRSHPDLVFGFHGSVQTNPGSNGANQWLTWGFRHGGLGTLFSDGTTHAYDNVMQAQMSENSGFAGLFGTSTAAGGNSLNGSEMSFANSGTFHAGGNFMQLSIGYWPGFAMNRGVMEAILWDRQLNAGERDRVETYLALKYGVTLGFNGTSFNYISPGSGSAIWNIATNAGYNFDIAGISRSDISGLMQLKSHSTNGPTAGTYNDIVTIANGTTFSAPSGITADDSHFIWGHNGSPTINTGAMVFYPTDNGEVIETIFQRKWKAQETGTINTVTLEFDMTNVIGINATAGTNDLAYLRLLVDEDGDFSLGATSLAPISYNNTTNIAYFQLNFQPTTGNPMTQFRGFFFTLGSTNFALSPLPVELVSFEATAETCVNEITWSVASETNCAYYEVWRSFDGNIWNKAGTIAGHGTSSAIHEYEFRDVDVIENGAVYYKLLQYDMDGAQHLLGSVLGVTSYCENNLSPVFYPNPVNELLQVQSPVDASFSLFDVSGKIVLEVNIAKGQSNIDLSSLAAGVYKVVVTTEFGKTVVEQLMKF